MSHHWPYYSPANVPPGSAVYENEVVPGMRLGLLPDLDVPRIQFSSIMTDEAPQLVLPNQDDHLAGVPAWNLGGNDRYGTCGPTALANYLSMVYWNLLGMQVIVTDDDVYTLYRASGNPDFPAQDNGVDLYTMLAVAANIGMKITYTGVTKRGTFDPAKTAIPHQGDTHVVKPIVSAQLSVGNIAELRAATAIFGGAELGVQLDTSQQAQTSTGVWNYAPPFSVWGGHAIMGAAYTSQMIGPDEEVITWQQKVGMTDLFVSQQMLQAFAIILPCHLTHPAFLAGVNLAELRAQYKNLTGKVLPA